MNLQAFKNQNGWIILICIITIILIYSLDVPKLAYRLTAWEPFGQIPIPVSTIQYFVADTPNVIGYVEPGTGEMLGCATTVAYIQAADQKTYRCCDTGDRISCLEGDFSNEIPAADPACIAGQLEMFGISASEDGLVAFGNCHRDSSGGVYDLTTVKTDGQVQLLWKYLNTGTIMIWSNILRCLVAPTLLLTIILIIVVTLRAKPREPIPRF